jgi:hypothetical protein
MNNSSSGQFLSRPLMISSGGLHYCRLYLRITHSFQDGLDDFHATHAADVAQNITELHVHLRQHFLHTLNRTARLPYQIAPVAVAAAASPRSPNCCNGPHPELLAFGVFHRISHIGEAK